MSTPEPKIAALEVEITELTTKLNNATSEPMQLMYGNMITAIRQDITALRAQAAAAGNYTARDLTSFI